MKITRWLVAGLASLLPMSLAACGTSSSPSQSTGTVASANTPHAGGTLTIGMKGDALTLDPMLTTDEYSKPVESLLYNSLVKMGPNQKIEPDLAKSWSVSSNGLVYTFNLHRNVQFHHGSQMTAADVVYSFNRIMSTQLASPWGSFFQPVKSVQALNNDTVQVTLSQPDAPFLPVVASFLVIMDPTFVNQHGGNLQRVEDGTGPYILSQWIPNQSITLVRNPHYFVHGEPYFNKVVFQIIPSTTARIAALQSGQIQFAEFLDPKHYGQLEAMASAHKIVAEKYLSSNYHMFGFNTQWGPFKHQKVRLAFSYALNRPQILASAGFNEGMVTGILTPALSRWAIPTSQYPSYTQNIATAKRLLAEAGYPHGFSFNIMAPSSFPVDLSSAVIIANQLQAIGVTAHVVPTEWGTYVNNWVKRSFESFTGENGDWTDPDLAMYAALHTGGSTNAFQFSNSQVDQLLQQGRQSQAFQQRYQTYAQLQKVVVQQSPMLYTFASYNLFGISPTVKGYVHVSGSAFSTLQSAWFSNP
ncbi:MAG: ABC transporter substrate-binding protein [Sulfobacillus sp.]